MFPGDLKRMHKTNVEAYDSGGRVARIPVASRTGDRNFTSCIKYCGPNHVTPKHKKHVTRVEFE